jgi:ArsR family transcriptional regulator, arsenate/arsenite/antimonite-responsive transcriptional repressor
MGAIKYDVHEEEDILIALLLKSIASPARMKILRLLSSKEGVGMSQKELTKEVGLSQSTVAEHLRIMKDSGLLETKLITNPYKKSNCLIYRISDSAIEKIIDVGKRVEYARELFSDSEYAALTKFFNYFDMRLKSV